MWSLKSWNLRSVAIFEPADLFTKQPFSTTQLEAFAGLSKAHPTKSRPLNSPVGLPHLRSVGGLSAGARWPFHVHAVPFGPLARPVSVPAVNFPSKTRAVWLSSSSFGETN